ncbi:MAG: hypothetical protein JXA91_00560 [Candidatus Thermoplasmatota archaeon]|nr:hypothetical protein [Candidatus Thermoplasmatota archaeon]
MIKSNKKGNNFTDNDNAVAGIVVSILIVGLVLSVIYVVQLVYIPNWMAEKEAEHIDEVADQFSLMKFAIDTQSLTEKDIPVSTSITLGSKELPFLSSNRAFGFLRIDTESCCLDVTNDSSTFTYALGCIKYSSKNAYFLDRSYSYEAGAIISSQSKGSIISVIPYFYADYDNVSELDITFKTVKLTPIGEKTSVSGFGTYPIQTQYYTHEDLIIPQVSMINITTLYPTAWRLFLNTTLKNNGLTYGLGNDYWFTTNSNGIILQFGGSITVDLSLYVTTIKAQIAPGWIE